MGRWTLLSARAIVALAIILVPMFTLGVIPNPISGSTSHQPLVLAGPLNGDNDDGGDNGGDNSDSDNGGDNSDDSDNGGDNSDDNGNGNNNDNFIAPTATPFPTDTATPTL